MARVEGLHTSTGNWVVLAEVDDTDEAKNQIQNVNWGGFDVIGGVHINATKFSAFRVVS